MLWGYSGGSQASEFAVELQPKYASELKVKGAALGGLVENILAILENVNATPLAGLTPNALLGLLVEYPDVLKYLTSRVKTSGPQNATTFFAAKQNSFTQSIQEFGGQDIYGYFIGGKADVVDYPVLNNAFNNDGTMGVHGVPKVPLFIDTEPYQHNPSSCGQVLFCWSKYNLRGIPSADISRSRPTVMQVQWHGSQIFWPATR